MEISQGTRYPVVSHGFHGSPKSRRWLREMLRWFNRIVASVANLVISQCSYSTPDAIRCGDAWYQAFPQDIIDDKTYGKLEMPVLGLGSTGYGWLKAAVTPKATNFQLVKVENSGHFMQEEQPEFVTKTLVEFLKN